MNDMDQAKTEAFAGTMMGILNGGALSLMTSVGYETGLFDVMADLPPSSSQEIADAAGLNERYVREWLAAMATGGILERSCTDARDWWASGPAAGWACMPCAGATSFK